MRKSGSLNLMKPDKERSENTIKTISKELSDPEKEYQNDIMETVWKCRYTAVLIGFLSNLSLGIHRTVMSVTIVAMVNNSAINQEATVKSDSCPNLAINISEYEMLYERKDGELIWSPKVQGYILGIFFFGYVTSQIPAARFAERYGCKWFFFLSALATALLTMLLPILSWVSPPAVIVIQALRGLAQGFIIPCTTVLVTNWCPKTERGFMYSITVTGQFIGPILGNIFAGYVSESPGGWPYVFYSLGALGIVFTIYIFFFLTESPKEHPGISTAELNFILENQEQNLSRKRPKLPWIAVVKSFPIYALSLAFMGRVWAFSAFWTVHSTFLGTILHYPIAQNGLLSAAPFLSTFVSAQISAWISLYIQQKKIVSVDVLRKFWVFISSFGYSTFVFGTYMAGCNKNLSVTFAVLSMCCMGLGTSGVSVIPTDMSPTFAGTIQSICNAIGFLCSILLPILVGYLTEGNQTLEQWNKVFFISIGIVMSSAIIFVIFGSAKIQPWNFVEEEFRQSDERQSEKDKHDEVTKF